ncbi:trypco2 family protein [Streptomyces synnematoformans]|uniref:Trypsin-co-occurring domain-containing protein n=1 Tax=Streptomyces synnematoformans TaxID=415721 RepID=A0ABP4KS11_9ACTN
MGHEARNDELVGLADAIAEVRRELAQAEREGERGDGAWRFRVDRVSLEFAMELHRTGEGRLSLRFGVVEAGAGGSATRVGTHRMQLELVPHGAAGERPIGR